MTIIINVIGQQMAVKGHKVPLAPHSENFIKLTFLLPPEWKNFKTFAQFRQSNNSPINVYLDESNSVYVPREIKAGNFTVMLYGAGESIIGTTNCLIFDMVDNCFSADAIETDLTPTLYQQLLNEFKSYLASTKANSESASGSATAAANSATASQKSAQNAETNAGAAQSSAEKAAESASRAAASAFNAEDSEGRAAESADVAGKSAAASEESASGAATSATNASKSAASAKTSADNAASSEARAASSEANARNSATAASESAKSASDSETDSSRSASASAKSASDAASSATASATSAGESEQSKTQAQEYAQNAYNSAVGAESAKDDAEDARDEIRSMRAEAVTLSPGSDATASYSDGLLSLGIPRGDKGDPGEVTQAEFDELSENKADIIVSSASGAIASFQDGAEAPVKSLTVGIEPVQEGTGDPSPDNVRPISGWTGAKVTRTGKNLLNLVESEMIINGWNKAFPFSIKEGTYILSCQNQFGSNALLGGRVSLTDENNVTIKYLAFTYDFGKTVYSANPIAVTKEEASRIKRIVFELRAANATYADIFRGNLQLEIGSTATTYESYQGQTYDIEFPSEAGTVHGGTLDVTNGVLTVDRASAVLSSSNLYILNGKRNSNLLLALAVSGKKPGEYNFNSDRFSLQTSAPDKYTMHGRAATTTVEFEIPFSALGLSGNEPTATMLAAGKTWMEENHPQLVYELAEPISYTLTASQITTLLGQNNIWADTGDMSVTYRADTKLYIQNLTKPTEDDMTANAAITSGKFFMINNRLFLATAAIASGAMIIPGTNCSELSLADALNNINS